MRICTLRLELEDNRRVIDGLEKLGDHFWILYPTRQKDILMVDLEVDFGRYDAEGDAYVIELLNIVPADLIDCYLED